MPHGDHRPYLWEDYVRRAIQHGEWTISRRLALHYEQDTALLILHDTALVKAGYTLEHAALLVCVKRCKGWQLISAHPKCGGDVFACNHLSETLGLGKRWMRYDGRLWETM